MLSIFQKSGRDQTIRKEDDLVPKHFDNTACNSDAAVGFFGLVFNQALFKQTDKRCMVIHNLEGPVGPWERSDRHIPFKDLFLRC